MWRTVGYILLVITGISCRSENMPRNIEIYQTSADGDKMKKLGPIESYQGINPVHIKLNPSQKFQQITGFGGSFTESSAHLLSRLSADKRKEVLEGYFGDQGSRYSLTRTHINSCDFSLGQYAYAMDPEDKDLTTFDISHDHEVLIPMIKEAQKISSEGFNIISSPWTAPPWMKDNKDWVGGQLLPEYYDTWALYFAKYIESYTKAGVPIWGITVENEPLGNGSNWESMHFTAREMNAFVAHHLGPVLQERGHENVKILGYDQNRDELRHWVDVMYDDTASAKYWDGTAIHWYASTFMPFEEELDYAKSKAPEKHFIQTEACVDSEIPAWKEDDWYWSKEATDWGYDWAAEDLKYRHPKYVPAYRYARDIIACLNHGVDGWIDWNMVLDRQGGLNWFENWCVAPVIVDTAMNEVYFTPLFYVLQHFSRFIRPGDYRIGVEISDSELMVTATTDDAGNVVMILFNPSQKTTTWNLQFEEESFKGEIPGRALQTVSLLSNRSIENNINN